MSNTTLHTHEVARIRVECKIHGGYWHMPLVAVTNTTVTIELLDGKTTRDLPRVSRNDLRFVENGAVV